MINAQLNITPPAIGRPARLRADRIRRDTLTQLAAALREDHDGVLQDRIDRLVDAMGHDPSDNEVDALVADIESAARMDTAVMDLTAGDVRQLFEQAARAVAIAGGSVIPLPEQRDRRAS